MIFKPIRPWFLLGFALLGFACAEDKGKPAIHPVSGQILVDGKPAAKALITFHPVSSTSPRMVPYAETDADGSFRPSTHLTKDGAPAGEYTISIVWPEYKLDHGEEVAGRDRLGGKYGNPSLSNLKVTIKEGENVLPPFELKSSR